MYSVISPLELHSGFYISHFLLALHLLEGKSDFNINIATTQTIHSEEKQVL